jgi:23S rRNA (cytosine1962-C5)-methyltransferase
MHSYPTLIIRKDRERALINRHPWLFSGAIQKVQGSPNEGDIVRVVDVSGRPYAYGFYQGNTRSIAARLFYFTEDDVTFDNTFWTDRFDRALALRKTLGLVSPHAGYRLIFSEGDFVPGLVVDIFDDTAFLQIGSAGISSLLPLLTDFLATQVAIKHIYDGNWLLGGRPDVEFVERGLKLSAHVEQGQKTGYFFDQRDNRELVGHYARDRKVLDAFCYSGGFTCHALKGGAKSVTSLDISEDAIARCTRNMAFNFPADTRHKSITSDCFDYLREMEPGEYDLIVLDPPAFAKSAQAVDRAARGYKDINLVALQNIAAGGLLFTFSCSQHISHDLFRKIIFGAAKDAGRNVRVLHQMTQAPDHPVDICHLEGEYLKGLALYVE